MVAGDIVADSNHHRDPAACNGGGKVTSVGVRMTHTDDEVNCVASRITGSIDNTHTWTGNTHIIYVQTS